MRPRGPALGNQEPRPPVRDALIQEWYNGREALVKDGAAGAARFKNGLGRHGDFTKIY
jgi:enoyl-CoA hydratase